MDTKNFNPDEEKKFITTTYIDFTRHGNRFGGKIKVNIDGKDYEFEDQEDITPAGFESSEKFGAQYPEDVTLVHPRGGMSRHGQTGESIVTGSGKIGTAEKQSPVLSKTAPDKVKGARRGKGLDYKESGISMDFLKQIKALINTRLNEIVNNLSPEKQAEFIKPENKELRAKYREQAQIFGLKEAMKNEEAVKIAAENQALELMHAIQLSRRGVKGGDTKAIPTVGSGMFAESLFKYALVVENPQTGEKKIGFDDIDEIGGFTKQATAFRMKLDRDIRLGNPRKIEDFVRDTKIEYTFTDPERAKLFDGKKVYLDYDKVKELAESAKEKLQ